MATWQERVLGVFGRERTGGHGGLEILRYVGPGLLVTVGFIDPGNWASNMAAGSEYGYTLLWVVTLSTAMLVVLQHDAARLGIATGQCLAEAATAHLPRWLSRTVLATALGASVATTMAEVLGGAVALRMLFGLDVRAGCVLVGSASLAMLLTGSYRKVERWIIGFVSLIGASFLFELLMVHVSWPQAVVGWVVPDVPAGSMPVVMSVLGAVVMPHNLFLHSEIIQSSHFEGQGDGVVERKLRYEFYDTLLSMVVGWAINSAMVLLAAAAFFGNGIAIGDLAEAAGVLSPLVGPAASLVFAAALLLAGLSSSVTAGMAAGTISAGMFGEEYDIRDRHSSIGVVATFVAAMVAAVFVRDPFAGLVWSQALLSVQLPVTILLQIYLTSSRRVMGRYANGPALRAALVAIAAVVTALNAMLLVSGV